MTYAESAIEPRSRPADELHHPIPRRAAEPAAGLRPRRPAGEAAQARARAHRPVPVPQREDAVLHGQRRQGLLPLLRLRGAWRRHRLRDADRGADLPGGGREAGRHGRAGGSPRQPRGAGPGEAGALAARRQRGRGQVVREAVAPAPGARGARLSPPPRPVRGDDRPVPAGLRAGVARRAQVGADGRRLRRGDAARGRPAGEARGRPRQLRPLPRPGDLPDRRPARPGDRLRRPHPRRRQAEISQHLGHAAVPQGPHALRPRPGAREPAQPAPIAQPGVRP